MARSFRAIRFALASLPLALSACREGAEAAKAVRSACPEAPSAHGASVNAIVFSRDGNSLYTGSSDATIKRWSMPGGTLAATWREDSVAVYSLAMSGDGAWLAVGAWNRIRLLDPGTGKTVADWQEHEPEISVSAVRALAFRPDNRQLASVSDYVVRRHWAVPAGNEEDFSVVPSGMAAGYGAGGWEFRGGNAQRIDSVGIRWRNVIVDGIHPYAAAFSPDGETLAAGYVDQVILWSLPDSARAATFTGPAGGIPSLAWSPDGRWLAAGSENGTIRVWDVPARRAAFSLEGHAGEVGSLAFSPNGARLVSASEDGTVRSWRMPEGAFETCFSDPASRPAPSRPGTAATPPGRASFLGTLGDYPIWMELDLPAADGRVSGSYEYLHVGKPIDLRGKSAGNALALEEIAAGKVTGAFTLQLIPESPGDTVLEGSWHRPGGKSALKVRMETEDAAHKSCAGLADDDLLLANGHTYAWSVSDWQPPSFLDEEEAAAREEAKPKRTYAFASCHEGLFGTRREVLVDREANTVMDLRMFDKARRREVVIGDEIEPNKWSRFLSGVERPLDSLLGEIRKLASDSAWAAQLGDMGRDRTLRPGEIDTLFSARGREDLRIHVEAGVIRLGFAPFLGMERYGMELGIPDEIFIPVGYAAIAPYLKKNSPLRRLAALRPRG